MVSSKKEIRLIESLIKENLLKEIVNNNFINCNMNTFSDIILKTLETVIDFEGQSPNDNQKI